MIPILGDIIREAGDVLSELLPDADKKAELRVRLAELADQADAREDALLQGQIETNRVEAASGNIFVAGWRPFIGWGCGVIFVYSGIVAPILKAVFQLQEVPVLSSEYFLPVLFAMLGVSVPRTVEKLAGVAGGKLGSPAHLPPALEPDNPSVKKKKHLLPSWLR